jgi:hypothetical protein
MTVQEFRKTMLQIDQIVWIDEDTKKEVLCPFGDEKVVDAYFSTAYERVKCAVFIKKNN